MKLIKMMIRTVKFYIPIHILSSITAVIDVSIARDFYMLSLFSLPIMLIKFNSLFKAIKIYVALLLILVLTRYMGYIIVPVTLALLLLLKEDLILWLRG